jgi:site-specific DNA recombinase
MAIQGTTKLTTNRGGSLSGPAVALRGPSAPATGLVGAIYARVSTTEQGEGTSLATQAAACAKLAKEEGLLVPPQYIFREMESGAAPVRPVLEQVRALVRERLVSAVICYSSDRLSRDSMQLLFFVDEVLKAGAKLHFVTENFEDSETGRLILYVRGFASALERQRIIERTIRGKKARLQAGKLIGASPLYGYTLQDGKREMVQAQAEVVKRIFTEAVAGRAIRAVAAGLTADGIPSPRGKATWGRSTVIRILHEEAYRGLTVAWKWKTEGNRLVRRPEEERILLPEGTTPRIVSDDDWFRVQARLERNGEVAARNLKHAEQYLSRGHIVCGHCGFPMWGETRLRYGSWSAEYRCRGRTGHVGSTCRKGQGLPSISGERLDQFVWEQVARILADPDLLEREAKKRAGKRPAVGGRLSSLQSELASIERGQERLMRAISSGEGDDGLVDRLVSELRGLRKREVDLRDKLAMIQASDRVRAKHLAQAPTSFPDLAGLRSRLATLDFDAKRLALEALAVRIEVFSAREPRRAVLTATLPPDGSRAERTLTFTLR